MNTSILVSSVMKTPAPFLRVGTTLGDVVAGLHKHGVMGLPVLGANDEVVGFVSEQDCIHAMLVSSYHCEGAPTVDDVMHAEVLSVSPEQSIVDIAQTMGKDRPKIYPVVDDGQLVGLVTRSAILHALWENRSHCDNPNRAA